MTLKDLDETLADPFKVFEDNFYAICQKYRISTSVAEEIKKYWQRKDVKGNEILFNAGKSFDQIWFVAKGAVRSKRIDKGVEWIYSLSVQGHYVGDYKSFLTGEDSSLHFETIVDSVIFFIEKKDLEYLYDTYPEANEFGRFMAEYAADFVGQRILAMQTMTLTQRYDTLMKTSPDFGTAIPQRDIASYLGAKPQSLSRIKGKFPKGIDKEEE